MIPERIEHVFWDWNGTLLNDAALCRDVMNGMLASRNMDPLSEARYMALFDFPVQGYYERLGFDFETESFERLGAEFIDGYEQRRHEALLHSDAKESLRYCRERGVSQSILSAYRHESLEEMVELHGLRHWFSALHGHHDLYASGKIPQARRALEELRVPPQHAVLIGDTAHDFDVAREIGIHCILVPGGNHTEQRLNSCGCPVVSSCRLALDLLKLPA